MTADDLTAPLRRRPKRRSKINLPATPIIAGTLALFLAVFVLWAIVADDPFGGEPMAVVSADLHIVAKPPAMPGTTPPPSAQPQQGLPSHDATPMVPSSQASSNAPGR